MKKKNLREIIEEIDKECLELCENKSGTYEPEDNRLGTFKTASTMLKALGYDVLPEALVLGLSFIKKARDMTSPKHDNIPDDINYDKYYWILKRKLL